MARVHLSYENALAPGDLRQLGQGDRITLAESVKGRHNWTSLLSALGTATARGACICWESEPCSRPTT
jgi:hypothetical protein